MTANDDLDDYLGQLHRNNLEPSFGAYMEPAAGWASRFDSVASAVGSIANSDPKDASLIVGRAEAPHNSRNAVVGIAVNVNGSDNISLGHTVSINGKNNIVIGGKLTVVGDDQVIIGKFDLNAMQERLAKLEQMVEHLWWMPGGPMCQEAEQRFNETMSNLASNGKDSRPVLTNVVLEPILDPDTPLLIQPKVAHLKDMQLKDIQLKDIKPLDAE